MDWTVLMLKILLTIITIIFLLAICVPLVVRIQRKLVVQHTRDHGITLTNGGNFPCVFELSASSLESMFTFKFLVNDIPLISVSQTEEMSSSMVAQDYYQHKMESLSEGRDSSTRIATKRGRAIVATAGYLASLLGTVASLLPETLASKLRVWSETARNTQLTALTAVRAPEIAERKVRSIQHQTDRIVKAASGERLSTSHQLITSQSHSPTLASSPARMSKAGMYVVQTQPVEPGSTLSLKLHIETIKRSRPVGTYAYTLSSQQLPVEPLDGQEAPVATQGVLYFPTLDSWRYWLAPAANFLVVIVAITALVVMLEFIWA